MFGSYFKVAFRNLFRHKGLSAINIAGLALGMACCITILLWVRFHLSFDDFHANADRVYHLYGRQTVSGTSTFDNASTQGPMGQAMKDGYPEVAGFARMMRDIGFATRHADKPLYFKIVYFTDPSFFELFSFPLVEGDPRTALVEPNSLVLSRESAVKAFGEINPVGRILHREDGDFRVTGVVDVPRNSYIQFDMLISMNTLQSNPDHFIHGWGMRCLNTYLMLERGLDFKDLEKKFPEFQEKQWPGSSSRDRLYLHPLPQLHTSFKSSLHTYIYIFSAVALMVLLLACINFMNLSIARSTTRAREVSLRKVVGAARSQLMWQFISESVFLSFFALILAIVLIELALPTLNSLFDNALVFNYVGNWKLSLGMICVALAVGIISGCYPALIISSFQPVMILKNIGGGTGRLLLKRILVVSQFAVSIALIICALLVARQFNFLRSRDLGFDMDQVMILPINEDMRGRLESIRRELMQNPFINGMTASSRELGFVYGQRGITYEGMDPDAKWMLRFIEVDPDFIPFYGMELAAGRNFSRELSTDIEKSFILNEALCRKIGWIPESAIGREFNGGKVIGVVKDFHFSSMHSPIEPVALQLNYNDLRMVSIRINKENISEALKFLEDRWSHYITDRPFEYSFLDEDFASLYRADRQSGLLIGLFSIIALVIACLGLLGLISFTAERRTKEIGIRKVLGASVGRIILLLSREFLVLLGVSILIAWPVAWYVMDRWLRNFAYRIELNWHTFVLAGLIALAVAAITVSYQAIKAATANPVKALHYE